MKQCANCNKKIKPGEPAIIKGAGQFLCQPCADDLDIDQPDMNFEGSGKRIIRNSNGLS